MLSLDKVFNAQTVLKNIVRETKLVRAYGIAPDCELYLKPENLQITGSFKVRGSAYKIAMLTDEEKKKVLSLVLPVITRRALRLPQPRTASNPSSACPTVLPFPRWKLPRVMARTCVL